MAGTRAVAAGMVGAAFARRTWETLAVGQRDHPASNQSPAWRRARTTRWSMRRLCPSFRRRGRALQSSTPGKGGAWRVPSDSSPLRDRKDGGQRPRWRRSGAWRAERAPWLRAGPPPREAGANTGVSPVRNRRLRGKRDRKSAIVLEQMVALQDLLIDPVYAVNRTGRQRLANMLQAVPGPDIVAEFRGALGGIKIRIALKSGQLWCC